MSDRSYAMLPAMMALAACSLGIGGFGGDGMWSDPEPARPARRERWDVNFIDTPKAKGKRAKRRAKGKRS